MASPSTRRLGGRQHRSRFARNADVGVARRRERQRQRPISRQRFFPRRPAHRLRARDRRRCRHLYDGLRDEGREAHHARRRERDFSVAVTRRTLCRLRARGGRQHVSGGGAVRGRRRGQLLAERGLTWPHSWSADGRQLLAALRRGTTWSLASLSVDTGQVTVLFTEPAPYAYLRYPSISPLGDRIVYERTEITGNIWQIALRPDRRDGT